MRTIAKRIKPCGVLVCKKSRGRTGQILKLHAIGNKYYWVYDSDFKYPILISDTVLVYEECE